VPVSETLSSTGTVHFVDESGRISDVLAWEELDERAGLVAHHLSAGGVARGHLVAVAGPPNPHLVVHLLALWRLGATTWCLPDPAHRSTEQMASVVASCADLGAVRIVCASDQQQRLEHLGGATVPVDRPEAWSGETLHPASERHHDGPPPMIHQMTSGSTGVARPIEVGADAVTHNNLAWPDAWVSRPQTRLCHGCRSTMTWAS